MGQVHTTSVQKPECQHEKGDHTGDHDTCKPDFDEKDANISPRRKAPGPDKPSEHRSEHSEDNPSQPTRNQAVSPAPKAPEAKIKDDLPPDCGSGS